MKSFNDLKVVFEDLILDFKNQIIFLDVDGTLVSDGELIPGQSVIKQLDQLKKNNQVFLCTNSNDKIRNSELEQIFGLTLITHDHKKPSPRILDKLNIQRGNHDLLVIGDKFLTDGLFAKNINAQFIKIKRKISGKELLIIKLINFLDDILWLIAKLIKFI